MKQVGMAVSLVCSGLLLMAAASHPVSSPGVDPGLPDDYWDSPRATTAASPHDWSRLETNLHPEACAQCHRPQFDAWKNSLHAQAYSSGLVGQFPDMGHQQANDCLRCHAPLDEQRYTDGRDMAASIAARLKHDEGFDRDARLPDSASEELPLRHAGVTCAACHVRGLQRFGPPPRSSLAVGHQDTPAHGGFTATKDFEKSRFCASCHQFPQSMAVGGKPLENTLVEWQQSRFAREGVTCQQCHMPDRRHEFRGIHDPDMVRKGLAFELAQRGHDAVLAITSKWIGHAFPTYVTPRIIVRAEAVDAGEKVLRAWQWEIVREVVFDDGWQEKRDTRLMPGERREFVAASAPAGASRMRFTVRVEPDHFYKGVYRSLLVGDLDVPARALIRKAAADARANDYMLYEASLAMR